MTIPAYKNPIRPVAERIEDLLSRMTEANGDAAFIARALDDIARAKGMTQVACDAGLSRENLYRALSSDRTPNFDTGLKVISARDSSC